MKALRLQETTEYKLMTLEESGLALNWKKKQKPDGKYYFECDCGNGQVSSYNDIVNGIMFECDKCGKLILYAFSPRTDIPRNIFMSDEYIITGENKEDCTTWKAWLADDKNGGIK